jgi:dihydroorotate dehydrogenase
VGGTLQDEVGGSWLVGASLVELYTGLAYGGPALVPRIKRELADCLQRDGFKSISDAVGVDAKGR